MRNRSDNSEQVLRVANRDFRVPTGQLDLTLVTKSDCLVTTARASIRHAVGKFLAPPGARRRA